MDSSPGSDVRALDEFAAEEVNIIQRASLTDASPREDVRDRPDSSPYVQAEPTGPINGAENKLQEQAGLVFESKQENPGVADQHLEAAGGSLGISNTKPQAPEEVEIPLIPEVRKVNFEHFKNRYTESDGKYVIDALISGSKFHEEVQHLEKLRKRLFSKKSEEHAPEPPLIGVVENKQWIQRVRIQSPGLLLHLARAVGEDWPVDTPRTFFRPFRVFIYFQSRMKTLLHKMEAKCKPGAKFKPGVKDGDQQSETAIFSRGILVDQNLIVATNEDSLKIPGHNSDRCISEENTKPFAKVTSRDTEKKKEIVLNDDVDGIKIQDNRNMDETDADDDVSEVGIQEPSFTYNMETLRAMRCYVSFVEKEILPLYNLFHGTSRTKVRFEDLWLLFRHGDLIFASQASPIHHKYGSKVHNDPTSTQSGTICRVTNLIYRRDFYHYPSFAKPNKPKFGPDYKVVDNDGENKEDVKRDPKGFDLESYYIDFDGASYGPVSYNFTISPFDGEIDIRSLPCYPIRYLKDQDFSAKRKARGRKFKEYIESTHNSYRGWTAALTPTGGPIRYSEDGKDVRYPEFIESHVILDFDEAFRVFPFWKPQFSGMGSYDNDAWWRHIDDKYDIIDWRTEVSTTEKLQVDDGIFAWQHWEYLEKDRIIVAYKAQAATTAAGTTHVELKEEDYILLPSRLFGYVLRDRKFAVLDIQSLRPLSPQQNTFDRLKIPKDYKRIVKGVVASHFAEKDLERKLPAFSTSKRGILVQRPLVIDQGNSVASTQDQESPNLSSLSAEWLSQDVIEGKGRGLVILLHGVPGVGKTATAEAVALEYRKPLFVITCGDLGLTPSDVERHLTDVFRLAHLWDCVLLLDEADVFLSSRSTSDLNRNALVSVFLRVLEYYSGILFLTTNRAIWMKHSSHGFTSSFIINLSANQTLEIFKVNINRLRETAKIRSQITKEPELQIDTDSILDFAHRLFEPKKSSSTTPWNGRQIRNAFQVASSLAYNVMHTEYAQRLDKKKKGELQQAEHPTPVLDEKSFETVAAVTADFDEYMQVTRGNDDAGRAQHHGERADKMRAKHDLGISRLEKGAQTPTRSFAKEFEMGNERKDPRSDGPDNQHYERFGSRERDLYTTSTSSYDRRRRAETPEAQRTRRLQTSERYDERVEYVRSPPGAEQGRRDADFAAHDAARSNLSMKSASRSGMEYQDQPSRGYLETPPQTIRTSHGGAQYEAYDRRQDSPSLRPAQRVYGNSDPDEFD